jgi:hypothetical protein
VNYEVEIADEATEKLRSMPKEVRRLIGYRVFLLQDNLGGDVQKLRGSKNEYKDYPRFLGLEFCKWLSCDLFAKGANGKVTSVV